MDHDEQRDVLVEVERGNEEQEKNLSATVSDEKIDDSIRKILTVSATSLALAGTIMSWVNSYLGKPLPDGGSQDNANLLSTQQQQVTFEIPHLKNLQILFICFGSSGIGILIGVAFIAYQISLLLREMKSSAETSRSPERFERMRWWSLWCHIFLFFGVVLGFVSIALAVLLFHNHSIWPFLSFLLPLVFFAVLAAAIAFCKLN